MGINLIDAELRRIDVRDRIEKNEVSFLSLCDNAISNWQEYNKISGVNIDMRLKRIQDTKDLFDRIKKKIIEYSLDRSLEDLLYLSIQECVKRIKCSLAESKHYLENVKKARRKI